MFTITSRQDVLYVAKTFGLEALDHIIRNSTMNADANRIIIDTRAWAANEVIAIEHVNDGNNVYEVDACFNAVNVAGMYITGIDDITIIRSGMGNFSMPLRSAMESKEISTEQCAKIINEITARNEAAAILYP